MKLYNELASFYFEFEKQSRNFPEEIDFLKRFFQSNLAAIKPPKLIDYGCGTGEHVGSLFRAGYDVTGVDSSPQMIAESKKRFPHCRFRCSSIKGFFGHEKAEGFVSLLGTFNYLLSDKEISESLEAVFANLLPGGCGVFEIWNALPFEKIRYRPLQPVCSIEVDNRVITRHRGFRFVQHRPRIVEVSYLYETSQGEMQDSHLMRIFTLEEIEMRLVSAGFIVEDRFGDFNRAPFHENSGKLILTVKRAK